MKKPDKLTLLIIAIMIIFFMLSYLANLAKAWDVDTPKYAYNMTNVSGVIYDSADSEDLSAIGAPTEISGVIGTAAEFRKATPQPYYYNAAVNGTIFNLPHTVIMFAKEYGGSDSQGAAFYAGAGAGHAGWILGASFGGVCNFTYGEYGYYPASLGGTACTYNKWYCIAGVYNGTQALLYINGTLMQAVPAAPTIAATPAMAFGRSAVDAAGQKMNGSVDEARIYDRALSAAEIQTYCNNGFANFTANETGTAVSIALDFPPDNNVNNSNAIIFGCIPTNAFNFTLWGNFSGGTWAQNATNATATTATTTVPNGVYKWSCRAENATAQVFAPTNRTLTVNYQIPSPPFNVNIVSPQNTTYTLSIINLNVTTNVSAAGLAWIYSQGSGNVSFTPNTSIELSTGANFIQVWATNGTRTNTTNVTATYIPYIQTYFRFDNFDLGVFSWTNVSGTATSTSGRMFVSGTGENVVTKYTITPYASGGYYVQAEMNGTDGGLIFNYGDASNMYAVNLTSISLKILEKTSGSWATLSTVGANYYAGQWYRLKAWYENNYLIAWVEYQNGTYINSTWVRDTTLTNGKVGVISFGSNYFDNFMAYQMQYNSEWFNDSLIYSTACGSGLDAWDINNDNLTDIAFSDWDDGNTYTAFQLPNYGGWNITKIRDIAGSSAEATLCGNWTGSQYGDVLVGNWNQDPVATVMNTSDLVTWSSNTLTSGTSPSSHHNDKADFNNDGFSDIAEGNDNPNIRLYFGNGYWFGTPTSILIPTKISNVFAGDLDNDNWTDMWYTTNNAGSTQTQLWILWNNHEPANASNWTSINILNVTGWVGYGMEYLFDMDNDGCKDAVTIPAGYAGWNTGGGFWLKGFCNNRTYSGDRIWMGFDTVTAPFANMPLDLNGDKMGDSIFDEGYGQEPYTSETFQFAYVWQNTTGFHYKLHPIGPAGVNYIIGNQTINGQQVFFYTHCRGADSGLRGLRMTQYAPVYQNKGYAPFYLGENVVIGNLTFYQNTTMSMNHSTGATIIPQTHGNQINANITAWNVSNATIARLNVTPQISENITFRFSGLTASHNYTMAVDGINDSSMTTGSDGIAIFSHNSWGSHVITLLNGGNITAVVPNLNLTVWNGTAWENTSTRVKWRCASTQTECEPINQNSAGSQCIFKVCNNGTAAGVSLKLNISNTCTDITIKADDDYTYAGAATITTTESEVHEAMDVNACVDICLWADYSNPPSCTSPTPYFHIYS